MDYTAAGVAKSLTRLSDVHSHFAVHKHHAHPPRDDPRVHSTALLSCSRGSMRQFVWGPWPSTQLKLTQSTVEMIALIPTLRMSRPWARGGWGRRSRQELDHERTFRPWNGFNFYSECILKICFKERKWKDLTYVLKSPWERLLCGKKEESVEAGAPALLCWEVTAHWASAVQEGTTYV